MDSRYKLTYFYFKGFAEPIRYMLYYLGADFEEVTFNSKTWPTVKPTTPFGKVPVLEIDGKTTAQSLAITRYLGKKAGLSGNDEWEDLMIDMAVDVFQDLRQEITNYVIETNEVLKAEKIAVIQKQAFPFYFGKLDQLIKENHGYLANKKLSWGDIWVSALIDDFQDRLECDISPYPNLKALHDKVGAIPQIKAWIDKRPIIQFKKYVHN